MVRELTMQHIHPTTDIAIMRKAVELGRIAALGLEAEGNTARLSQGFHDLSQLADARREFRMACVAKALSTIFRRMPEGNPEDLPFILQIALSFIDSLMGVDTGSHDEAPLEGGAA
jgi:hypothetical protein